MVVYYNGLLMGWFLDLPECVVSGYTVPEVEAKLMQFRPWIERLLAEEELAEILEETGIKLSDDD